MANSSRAKTSSDAKGVRQSRRSVASVPLLELRERLERSHAALAAAKRAPESSAARILETELSRQIRGLERDIAQAQRNELSAQ